MESVEFQLEGYEYIEKIGEGTYGKVFKARDLETNKIVALKFMPLIVCVSSSFFFIWLHKK
jgi:serine/threonine protein kinase